MTDPVPAPASAATQDPLRAYELVYLLGAAFQQLVDEFVRRLAAAGYDDLRPVHGFAFQVIAHAPEGGVTASELAERLGITKQAAGQMADDLEARGYVERQLHPRGGRRRLLVLSARGARHLMDAGRILHALEAEWAAALGPERVGALRGTLAQLVRTAAAAHGGALPPLRPVW